jgi:transaldolase
MNALMKLFDFGQSYWIDDLNRDMIRSGELHKRVSAEGLRGMTSNPAIFNKAISKSDDYDDQIRELAGQGLSTEKIYEGLAVKDVQDACDIFRPVYEQSQGLDGYVSLEVSPYLARHTEETMKEARHLFQRVDRPNLFIKIPGTKEGLPAIEQMLYEGININITLLFSIQRYEEVAKIYIKALQRRDAEGKDLSKLASVASFFVSRIDVLVDQLLKHRLLPDSKTDLTSLPGQLLGKIAVSNAKMAYQRFKDIFGSEQWKRLEAKGAKVQRPLWASTSTKTPEYSDVMYVEPFIGRHTVNTMPEETITAFADHGQAVADSVEKDIEQDVRYLGQLEELGIDLNCVTQQLENEGIQKFIEPFKELIKSVAEKQKSVS